MESPWNSQLPQIASLRGLGLRLLVMALLSTCVVSGCHTFRGKKHDVLADEIVIPNPLVIPATDREFLWNQIVDATDDYFKIRSEQRIQSVDGLPTPGRVTTYPQIGSTALEPWRRDSTPGAERLHATLQTIRRTATIEVLPVSGGYQVMVQVIKEIEDLDRPEHSSIGGAHRRHDGSIARFDNPAARGPVTLGWIVLGRDISLEQRILEQIQGRVLH